MKKITLVLCACAMAFAGLLVSCSNGSGTEQIIFRGDTSYDYAYTLSGTKVVTTQIANSDKRVLLTTTEETTSFDGIATLCWKTDDDSTKDYLNYSLNPTVAKANKVTTTKYSGSSASAQAAVADEHVDNLSSFDLKINKYEDYTFDYGSVTYTTKELVDGLLFYSFDDEKFYLGNISDNSDYAAFAGEKSSEKDFNKTITVTGNIEEDDSLTIVVTFVNDDFNNDGDDDDANTVDAQTTVWTFKLTKAGSAE